MGWTRFQLITRAFAEIGIGADYSLSPEDLEDARRSLDAMMATWNGRGIRLGYPLVNSPDSDLNDPSGIPDRAVEAVYLNLAIRIAPMYGRQPSPLTLNNAKAALSVLESRAAQPIPMQMPGSLPRGAGQRAWRGWSPFTSTPRDPPAVGPDGFLDYDD